MALLANYYVNWQTGDDGQDGDAPTHSGGTDGPKKHVNAVLDLIKNPAEVVSGEIFINVAGDVANPEDYIYQDATDVNIELTELDMSNPKARIVFRLTGWDNDKYNAGTEAPDGGASWAVGNVKPATLAPLIVDYGRVDVVGLGLSDPSGLYPVAATGPWGELTLNYCRLSGGLAGLRGDGDMSLVNVFVTDNDFGVLCEGGNVTLVGRNILHDNRTAGVRNRFRGSVACLPWWNLPTSKYQTTISTAAPKGAYVAVALETDSIFVVSDIMPDFKGGSRDIQAAAELQIVSTSLATSNKYVGVYVTERSLFVGKSLVRFSDAAVNNGSDTIPAARQFVVKSGEGGLVLD